jgi:hypothetical protein
MYNSKYKEKIGCSCQQCKYSKVSRQSAHKQAQRKIRRKARYLLKRQEWELIEGKIIEGYGWPG